MFTEDENHSKIYLNFRLITLIVLSLILGISVSYFILMEKIFYAVFFMVSFITFIVLFLCVKLNKKKIKTRSIFCFIFIFVFLIGAFLFDVKVGQYNNASLGYKTYNVSATIEYSEDLINGQKLDLTDVAISGLGKLKYGLELRVYGETKYQLGDRINFTARLQDKEILYDGRFMASDIADKIKYSAFVYDNEVIVMESSPNLYQKVNILIKDTLESGMSEQSFPIAYALLTGGSETIDEEVITTFRNTGVAHIFAVSGLHIGFLATALGLLFRKIKLNAYLKTLIISSILFFYSGICGFSASSIRACIMCTIMLLTNVSGHKYDGLTSVSLAGLVILILSPVQLFCVGFQLSFVVVTGILTLTPALTKLFKFLPSKIASSLATVFSAQLSGIPILLYAFNKFSSISIIVNLLFIPVVGALFVGLLILLVLGAILNIPKIMLFLPDVAIKGLRIVIEFFDKEFFLIGGFTLGIFALSYYLFMLVSCGFFNFRRITNFVLCIVLGLTCIFGVTIKSLIKDDERLYISGSENFCFTIVANDEEGVLIVSKITKDFNAYRLNRILNSGELKSISSIIVTDQLEENDFSQVAVRLLTACSSNSLYYFGEENLGFEKVVNSAYPKTSLNNYVDGKEINQNDFIFNSNLNGKCISFTVNEKTVGVFSEFNDEKPNYHGLNQTFDIIILTNYVEIIDSLYHPNTVVSYTYDREYVNAENRGNIKYYL